MWALVLGSAAGGGFPQWNCWCENCTGARAGTLLARVPASGLATPRAAPADSSDDGAGPSERTTPPRSRAQASLAISADRERWFLVNAPPDVTGSLERIAVPALDGQVRRNPVAAVLLTDAELDHTAGLLSLREGSGVTVFATDWVHRAAKPLVDILAVYCPVDRREVWPGAERPLDGSPLTYRAVPTGSTKRPRYAVDQPADPAAVVGYRFTDVRTGGSLLYLPCVPALTDVLLAELADCDCVLLDGTCWTDDELARVGLGDKTSRAMGHLPVSGPGGSLAVLADSAVPRRIYTHLNNTNPLLLEGSPERRQVAAAGVEVAYDGMEIEV